MALMPDPLRELQAELEKGTSLEKCQQCGCMMGTLEEIKAALSSTTDRDVKELSKKVESWLGRMKSSAYT